MTSPGVLLFIDNSNIFISGKDVADQKDGPGSRYNYRLEFEHLLTLALAGRPLLKAYVVGSVPPEEKAIWEQLEKATGVKPELFERGSASGGEQGLDQCLQVHMLRAISDYSDPQIAVLMTGDGQGYDDGVGFHADLKRIYNAGWGIEVLSWDGSCKRTLKEWAKANGKFIALNDHYESVTFVKGLRRSSTVNLSSRPLSTVRLSPLQAAAAKARQEEAAKSEKIEQELAKLKEQTNVKARRKAKHDRRFLKNKK
jgi:NYN domain